MSPSAPSVAPTARFHRGRCCCCPLRRPSVEVEARLRETVREIPCRVVQQSQSKVCSPVLCRHVYKDGVQCLEVVRLADDKRVGLLDANRTEVCDPVETGRHFPSLSDGVLVVGGFAIAILHSRPVVFGKARLDVENRPGAGCAIRQFRQIEHRFYVVEIGRPDL